MFIYIYGIILLGFVFENHSGPGKPTYNPSQEYLRLCYILANFRFTTTETEQDYYH